MSDYEFGERLFALYGELGFWVYVATAGLVIWEGWAVYRKGKLNFFYVLDNVTSFLTFASYGYARFVLMAIGLGALYGLGRLIHDNWAIVQLGWNWWTVAAVVVLADFTYYWEHRAFHRVNALWVTHTVHHSSPFINTAMAYRFGPLDGFVSMICHLPLTFFFDPMLVGFAAGFVQVYQFWIHTDRIQKCPAWMEAVMNTPSHHRVHHGVNPKYIDRNYGGIFIVFDKWFGTFAPEEEEPTYGITRQLKSADPITVFFHGFYRFGRKLTTVRSLKELACCFLKPPGWQTAVEVERGRDPEGQPVERPVPAVAHAAVEPQHP